MDNTWLTYALIIMNLVFIVLSTAVALFLYALYSEIKQHQIEVEKRKDEKLAMLRSMPPPVPGTEARDTAGRPYPAP